MEEDYLHYHYKRHPVPRMALCKYVPCIAFGREAELFVFSYTPTEPNWSKRQAVCDYVSSLVSVADIILKPFKHVNK